MSDSLPETPKIALVALFVTALITAQVLGVKLLTVPYPEWLPVIGGTVLIPAGVFAYAATFFASDCYTELYGRRQAQIMVNITFTMNLVFLGLVWLAITMPGSEAGVDPTAFANVLSVSTNIVVASLVAYLVSQNYDVIAFHRLKLLTRDRHLWLRNIGSTASSQFIDTLIFASVAFYLLPKLAGIGAALPVSSLVELIIGYYVIKLLIALLDTPIVYGVVGYVRRASTDHQLPPTILQ